MIKQKNIVLISYLIIILLVITSSYASAATKYWIGDNVDLAIDPDNVLFIDTTNNRVGSGTSSPDQKLQVVGNVMIGETNPTGGTLYLYGTTAGKYSRIVTTNGNLHIDPGYGAGGGNGLYLNYYNGGTIYFGTGASGAHSYTNTAGAWNLDNTLYTDGTGEVGIGVSNPTYDLQVQGTGTVAYFYSSNGIALQGTGTTRGLDGRNSGSSGRGVYGYATAGSGTTFGIYGRASSSSGYSGYFTGGSGLYSDGNEVYAPTNCRYVQVSANTASCSAPEELVGGGCYCLCGSNRLRYSVPSTNMLTWQCSCADCTAITWAICCG